MESKVEIFQLVTLLGKGIKATIATMFVNVKEKNAHNEQTGNFKKKN